MVQRKGLGSPGSALDRRDFALGWSLGGCGGTGPVSRSGYRRPVWGLVLIPVR